MSLRTVVSAALLGLCLSLSFAQAAEPPTTASVQHSLDKIAERKLPEADQKALQQVLEQTLGLLASRDDYDKRLAALKQQLTDAPRQTSENQRELIKLKDSKTLPVAQRYAALNVPQLEQLLSERTTQQGELQKALSEANSLIINSQTRPERAQAEISSNQTRTQQINNILKTGKDGGKAINADQRNQLNAELASLNALTLLRRQELAGNSLLQDLGNARHDLLVERAARLEQEIQDLQTLINAKRLAQSQEAVTQQSIEAQKAGGSSLLATESAINLKLSDYLLRATERLNQLTEENLQTKQQLDNLVQADQALDEQIGVLQGIVERLLGVVGRAGRQFGFAHGRHFAACPLRRGQLAPVSPARLDREHWPVPCRGLPARAQGGHAPQV